MNAVRPGSGFTLLEVVVALAILTMGITSAMGLFTAATAAHKRAIDRTHAAAIAEHVFADVESALERGVSPEELLLEPPLGEIQKNWPGYQVELTFFQFASGGEDEIILEVRVYWRFRGQEREEAFRQIITRSLGVR